MRFSGASGKRVTALTTMHPGGVLIVACAFGMCATGASAAPATAPSSEPLRLGAPRVQLTPHQTATLPVLGGVAPYSVSLSAPIAVTEIDALRGTIRIRAVVTGSAALRLTDAAGAAVTASVLVAPKAGFVPAHVDLALTGSPTAEFLAAQILAALQRAARPLPGARIVPAGVRYPADLRPGERLDLSLPVHVDGAGRYVDVDGIVNVHVHAGAPARLEPATLSYSDDPERIREPGVLYHATVGARSAVRLYYYHQAAAAQRQIAVVLDSPHGTARVRVVGHGAGPDAAVMFVGQSATARYLDDRARGAGVELDVPVGGPVTLLSAPMAAGDLVAGILDIGVIDGDPVRVSVLSTTDDSDLRTMLDAGELAGDGKQRRGEYRLTRPSPSPIVATLEVGAGEPPAIAVGDLRTALANLRPGGRVLAGDYGVLRALDLTFFNPTRTAAAVYLYERPLGYPVTTTAYFDGDPAPLRVRCVKTAATRYLIRAFGVAPETRERVTGAYLTDGASTYPLTFGLTTAPPPAPPATMTGADGCYPKPPASPGP